MTLTIPDADHGRGVGLPGQLSPTGLQLPESLSFAEWERIGGTLKTIRDSALRWWWGDWHNYGERRWGERYAQAVEESDYGYGSLRDSAWVCRQMPLSRRRDKLSFSHHREVAPLSPDEQDMWLADAESNGWGVHALRRMIAQTRQPARPTPEHEDARLIDEETGEVVGGSYRQDARPTAAVTQPDVIFSPSPPLDITGMVATGSVRDLSIQEEFARLMTRLLGAANDARLLVRHVPPDEMARLLDNHAANDERHVAPTIAWVQAVFAARDAAPAIRRIK